MRRSRTKLILCFSLVVASCAEPQQAAPPIPDDGAGEVVVVAEGSFVDKGGQQTSGSYRIERVREDVRLVLSEDFRTDEGPDLHIVLSPTEVAAAENETAMAEGAKVVAPLQAQTGAQTYDLQDSLDLEALHSVAIHCIEFTHLYGAAALEMNRP